MVQYYTNMWSLVIFLTLVTFSKAKESRIVHIAQGPVRGYKNEEENIFEFYSIPYATAPTGVHKFKAPRPPPVWSQPLDAVDKKICCPQKDFLGLKHNVTMQEDCLIANVYVPITKQKSLPVVVYVHGGAFNMGHGNIFTYRKLVSSKNIIVVTFNYRVGAHGFLCLGTEDIPGNAGMKDQVALLHWVKNNIASFGGNPDDVTLAGYSAGSASVDLLMISKMAKGLFKRVIPESGANTAAFSVQSDPLYNAKEYAKLLNFDKVDDIYALEEFYKHLSHEELCSAIPNCRPDSTFIFSPCVERETGEDRFLDDSPVNILRRGDYEKLPMLYGFANMEGLMMITSFNKFDEWKEKMNEKFSDFLPADLQFENDKQKEEVASKIKHYYFGDKPVGPETVLSFVNYFSDVCFTYSTLRSVKLQVEAGNTNIYLYEYSFVDDNTPLVPYTNVRGANHCLQSATIADEVKDRPSTATKSSEEYLKMVENMRTIWHSFITTGYPIPANSGLPEWPAVGADCSPHMSLNQTMELKGSLLKERFEFWDEIYNKHYRQPIPPPTPPPKQC